MDSSDSLPLEDDFPAVTSRPSVKTYSKRRRLNKDHSNLEDEEQRLPTEDRHVNDSFISTTPETPRRRKWRPAAPADVSAYFSPSSSHDSARASESDHTSPSRRSTASRRMLTQSQSLGELSLTRSPLSNPSTPSRGISRFSTAPENLSSPVAMPGTPHTNGTDSGPSSATKPRRVYGKSRTILNGENASIELAGFSRLSDLKADRSYADLRQAYDTVIDAEAGGSGNLLPALLSARAPQNVSDMRSKGENRRFMDEIGFVIDGISNVHTALGVRRANAIELLFKMRDDDWLNRARACGQIDPIWHALHRSVSEGDQTFNLARLLFVFILLQSGAIDSLIQSDARSIFDLAFPLLAGGDEPLDDRKNQTRQIVRLRKLAQEIGNSTEHVSTRSIASLVLSHCCEGVDGSTLQRFFDSSQLEIVQKALANEIDRVDRGDSADQGMTTSADYDFAHYIRCVQVLLLAMQSKLSTSARDWRPSDDLLPTLVKGGNTASALLAEKPVALEKAAVSCLRDTCQVLAILVNVYLGMAAELAELPDSTIMLGRLLLRLQMPTVFAEDLGSDENLSRDDWCCLVAALLLSMTSSDRERAANIGNTVITNDCQDNACSLDSCLGAKSQPFQLHLVDLFQSDDINSGDSRAAFRASLALMLASILLSNDASRAAILRHLRGTTDRNKVEDLLKAILTLRGLESAARMRSWDDKISSRDDEDEDDDDQDLLNDIIRRLESCLDSLP